MSPGGQEVAKLLSNSGVPESLGLDQVKHLPAQVRASKSREGMWLYPQGKLAKEDGQGHFSGAKVPTRGETQLSKGRGGDRNK